MTELGHHAPQVRLNYGLHLLAMGGDHETEPWAYRRKTLYSTDEWIQRRMARNALLKWEVKRPARVVLSPVEQEEAEQEFRIWDAEKAAVRRLEVLAERHKRVMKWHLKRERRRRDEAKEKQERRQELEWEQQEWKNRQKVRRESLDQLRAELRRPRERRERRARLKNVLRLWNEGPPHLTG